MLFFHCYYDTTDRDYVTLGGDSTREEMCYDFFLYYPAVDLYYIGSAKNPANLSKWMNDAQQAGYLTGDIDAAFSTLNFDELEYDSSLAGAEEFYDRLWDPEYSEYDGHYVICTGSNDTNNLFDIRPQPTDFISYEEDIFTCDDEVTSTDQPTSTNNDKISSTLTENKAISIGNTWIGIILGFARFV